MQKENLWRKITHDPIVLEHNHRQGEGSEWANALNRFRVGKYTQDDIKLLRKRVTSKKFEIREAEHVAFTNKEVNDHNQKMMSQLPSKEYVMRAKKAGPRGYRFKTNPDTGNVDTTSFKDQLVLKVEARVNLVHNINTVDDLVNGSVGTVVGIETLPNGSVDSVVVVFDDKKAGVEQRRKLYYVSKKYIAQNGTPIRKHDLEYFTGSEGGVRAKVTQFPLTLAYASTCHKMQGRSIKIGNILVIHWSNILPKGMAYVMLSRCENLADIYIVGKFDPKKIVCNPESLAESERIYNIFATSKKKTDSMYEDCFTVSYLNINRMKTHYEDVIHDHHLIQSDIMVFGETWLMPEENVSFSDHGFKDCLINVGHGKGLAAFIKQEYKAACEKSSRENFCAILMKTEMLDVIFLYLSKKFEWDELWKTLEEWIEDNRRVAVIGDTNMDYLGNHPKFIRYMEQKNFVQLVEKPTHRCGGLIDHIYVNQLLMEDKPFHSQSSVMYSDHDKVVLHIPKK